MAVYQLKDHNGNVTFMANEQIFDAIKEIRKTNKRAMQYNDWAKDRMKEDPEMALTYESWHIEAYENMRGMCKMFNMLTGYDLSMVNILFDEIVEIA